ncbi:MAG TPA: alpha/beta hydrolase [Ktedonobacterales bacterium]|nr:alpha/beta hydrolase [Ktedonobacterales bacterium]
MATRTTPKPTTAWSSPARPGRTLTRRLVAAALLLAGLLTFAYGGVSIYIATQIAWTTPKAIQYTPADFGLKYSSITFPAREDGVPISGWFIPGILPGGKLTDQRIIIMVHGARQNRADPAAGVLDIGRELAYNGFAVLSFDMRGHGVSTPAPFSLGYFEYRDVLGAVDFIHHGRLPYPELGRPKVIGGWGVSMGAATMIFAAAREPAIAAVVLDCPFADIIPILEREIPKGGGVPAFFTPGGLVASQALYGTNFYAVRPVDYIAKIAPRPIFLIHGIADKYIPVANHYTLVAAAKAAPNANVQAWEVPGADHAQSFHTLRTEYVAKLLAFYNMALGADSSGG